MSVGDVKSKKRGTGARFNDDKTPLQYLPPLCFSIWCNGQDGAAWLALQAGWNGEMTWGQVLGALVELYGVSKLDEAAEVFEYGAEKYAPFNWAKGMEWSIPLGCAMRHLRASSIEGAEIDYESGFSHLGHMFCNVIMLVYFESYYEEGNDLPTWLTEEAS